MEAEPLLANTVLVINSQCGMSVILLQFWEFTTLSMKVCSSLCLLPDVNATRKIVLNVRHLRSAYV